MNTPSSWVSTQAMIMPTQAMTKQITTFRFRIQTSFQQLKDWAISSWRLSSQAVALRRNARQFMKNACCDSEKTTVGNGRSSNILQADLTTTTALEITILLITLKSKKILLTFTTINTAPIESQLCCCLPSRSRKWRKNCYPSSKKSPIKI